MRKKRQRPFQPGDPGDWSMRPAARRRHLSVLVAVVLASALVVAIGYVLYRDLKAGSPGPGAAPSRTPAERPGAPDTIRAPSRTDTILRCTAPDGSTFYTNATSCDAADLDNRVNVVPAPETGADGSRPGRCLSDQPESTYRFLPECREVFTEALKVERFLSRAPDPAKSRRAREYCDLIAQGVSSGCMATSELFCYLHVCQQLSEQGQ